MPYDIGFPCRVIVKIISAMSKKIDETANKANTIREFFPKNFIAPAPIPASMAKNINVNDEAPAAY